MVKLAGIVLFTGKKKWHNERTQGGENREASVETATQFAWKNNKMHANATNLLLMVAVVQNSPGLCI